MPASNPVVFASEEDFRRMAAAVRHVERRFAGGGLVDTPIPPGDAGDPVTCLIQIDSPLVVSVGGFYNGTVVSIDGVADVAASPPWNVPEDVPAKVFEVNGLPLVAGDRYVCAVYGTYGRELVAATALAGDALVTANVNGSQESTTSRLEFAQATGVRVDAGATASNPDVVSLVYSLAENFVTDVCVESTLVKTYSTASGETHLMTDVTQTIAVFMKKKNVTLLTGTTIGSAVCVAGTTPCCAPPVLVCGTLSVSSKLKVVVSGGPTFDIVWNGTFWAGFTSVLPQPDCTDTQAFGLELTPNCDGTWNVQGVASYRGPGALVVTPTSTSPFLLTVTAAAEGSGACGGTVTFVVEEVT